MILKDPDWESRQLVGNFTIKKSPAGSALGLVGRHFRLPRPKIFSPAQSPKPTAECPLFPQLRTQRWSIASVSKSRHPEGSSRTSALPPRADIQIMIPGQAPADVHLAPNSGRKWVTEFMSAFDP